MDSINSLYNEILANIQNKVPVNIQFSRTKQAVKTEATESFEDILAEYLKNTDGLDDLPTVSNDIDPEILAAIKKACNTYGISENLIKAIIKQESNFKPDVVSSAGAMGLMQLMPGTAASLGVTDPFNIEQNVMGGTQYIYNMLTRYNYNLSDALAAYNAGPGNVNKYGGIPPFEETQKYVPSVMNYMRAYALEW